MITGRKPGDNITIMNTFSTRGLFVDKEKDKEQYAEFLTLVYKDCDTGVKYKEEIVNPNYEYYMVHSDKRVPYNRLFIPASDVEKITVPHIDLEKDIAERVGMKEFYYGNINAGNKSENRKIHLHPDVFNSDMNIEDHYRFRFDKMYKNEVCSITKSFFDIETDNVSMVGDFPQPGECPINAVSLILQEQKQVYSFLLRNPANPLIAEFERSVVDGSVFPEIRQFVIDAVGGAKIAERYNIDFHYSFLFYDAEDEINLIKDLFSAINTFKPDFTLVWNMSFDIPYIIARIQNLGYDPKDIMCHPDFKYKFAEYYVDERNKNDLANRGDFATISSYTTFLDQMIHFASRRKGQTKFIAFNLDYIGEAIAKVKKLDYKHITTNITELPYKDYKTFVFYNIMDTVVQYCIEQQTGDIDYVFGKCLINNTRYSKCHRQTVYLMNRGIKEFAQTDDGYIMGNNANKFNEKPTTKFPGAFVAEPRQLNDFSKMKIFGRVVDLVNNAIDLDYASLYPSEIRQFNIAAYTQIGMILIANQVHAGENPCNLDNWTRSCAFAEDLQSRMWFEFCYRWFHLQSYTELYHSVEQFFTEKMNPVRGLRLYERNGLIDPFIPYNPNLLECPFIFEPTVQDVYIKPNLDAWKEWREYATQYPNQHF